MVKIERLEFMVWGFDSKCELYEIQCKDFTEGLRLLGLLDDTKLFVTIHYSDWSAVTQCYTINGLHSIHYHGNRNESKLYWSIAIAH